MHGVAVSAGRGACESVAPQPCPLLLAVLWGCAATVAGYGSGASVAACKPWRLASNEQLLSKGSEHIASFAGLGSKAKATLDFFSTSTASPSGIVPSMEALTRSLRLRFFLQGENLVLWTDGSGGMRRTLHEGVVVEDFYV
ncbi:hypothetical protein U9M48_000902 [Paspalum notatum var. saurae]|uniref:Uncharacterized protein n=1 Tax=Paspalum notatum var. saurae TaxID=547442 RepID=A0AAQ3PHJ4_PASNO